MVAQIPPGNDPAVTPLSTVKADIPSVDDLVAELTAAREDVGRVALATRVLRAQSQLEGLMQIVRMAQASGDGQHALALASEAGRIGRGLARLGGSGQAEAAEAESIHGQIAVALRLARQVGAVAAGRRAEDAPDMPDPTTDLKA